MADETQRLNIVLARWHIDKGMSDVPVIGESLPSQANVKIDSLDLIYASKALGQTELKELNGTLVNGGNDLNFQCDGIPAGMALGASVKLGDESRMLVLPLTRQKSLTYIEEEDGKGLVREGSSELKIKSGMPTAWWNVGKSLGPVRVDRVGAGFTSGPARVWVLLDAGIDSGGVSFGTRGLGVGVLLDPPHTPAFHLDGLEVGFKRPPVEVSGSLIALDPVPAGYSLAIGGAATIKVPMLSAEAVGFYAHPDVGNTPSLFVFGHLGLAKGKGIGPPMFKVKELAAGFGYNSSVREPDISQVHDFPFVSLLGDTTQKDPLKILDGLLKESGNQAPWVKISPGSVWLAAGLEADTFEYVTTKAVAILEFGDDFAITLLGNVTAQFPKGDNPYAKVEMNVKAGYRSSEDTLSYASSIIKDRSYLLTKDCTVQGDSAARVWFGRSKHPGEFVYTIGGYPSDFKTPSYYPTASRCGIDWRISDVLNLSGHCYAALTPQAVMAGYDVAVTAHVTVPKVVKEWIKVPIQVATGILGEILDVFTHWEDRLVETIVPTTIDAGFNINLSVLIEWDPFHFELHAGGAAYVYIGPSEPIWVAGELNLWGLPVGGVASVTVWGITVTLPPFGADRGERSNSIGWEEFWKRCVPIESALQVIPVSGFGADSMTSLPPGGWAMASAEYSFLIHSGVPVSELRLEARPNVYQGATQHGINSAAQTDGISLRPVRMEHCASRLDLTVKRDGFWVDLLSEGWHLEASLESVPRALWGSPPTGSLEAEVSSGVPAVLEKQLVGVRAVAASSSLQDGLSAVLLTDDLPNGVLRSAEGKDTVSRAWGGGSSWVAQIAVEIASSAVTKRTTLYTMLPNEIRPPDANGSLEEYAKTMSERFVAEPMMAA
ncbi:DUF6603 domain-containing protein [Streptomyces sp. NPDC094438]|uniref:DUF6603 domain-containing protein n=1 Tax=Streptomyces sp. NPDC094438 TaxID=3366061 RepID=UPI0037FBE747